MENGKESAFPRLSDEYVSHQWGLSKREYFAGLAMQGLLAGARVTQPPLYEIAVKYADALLKELDK